MRNALQRTYVVPGTRRKFTGLAIAGGIAGAGTLTWFIVKAVKNSELKARSKHYGLVEEAATDLGMALGTAYSIFNLKHYMVYQDAVVQILEEIDQSLAFNQVKKDYLKQYNRVLAQDLQEKLSRENWDKIRHIVLAGKVKPREEKRKLQRESHSSEFKFFNQ